MDCSPLRLLCPWDSPGKNTGVGCHFHWDLPNSGIKLRSPSLQADSLWVEIRAGKTCFRDGKCQHNVCVCVCARVDLSKLLKQLNSLPLTKWKEEGKGGRRKSRGRERGKDGREGEGICLFAFVCNWKN